MRVGFAVAVCAAGVLACTSSLRSPAMAAEGPGDARGPAPEPSEPSEPEPRGVWNPGVPEFDPDAGFAWLAVQVWSACERDSSGELPQLVTDGETFERLFCQRAEVDFVASRVAVYAGFDAYAERQLVITSLRAEAGKLLLFVEAAGACHGVDGWSFAWPAALIPASEHPVVFVKRESAAPPCSLGDSYGY